MNLMLSTAVSMRRKRAEDLLDRHARLERRVALRIERLGLRHAAGHPQHDDGIGRGGVARPGLRRLQRAARARRAPTAWPPRSRP